MIAGTFSRNLVVLTTASFLTVGGALAAAPAAFAQAAAPADSNAAPVAPQTAPAATPKPSRHSDAAVEARIKRLHDQLKITPAESDQWNAVAQIMRDNERQIDDLTQARDKDAGTMSAIDNLRNYQMIADAHADGLKKLVPAFATLYGAMSDRQKATADTVFGRHARAHAAGKKPGNG